MKRIVFFVTLAMALFLFTNPAWSYTADVGWAWFGTYDVGSPTVPVAIYDYGGNTWTSSTFSNTGFPTVPPYSWVNNPNGNSISWNSGNSMLTLTPSSPSDHVGAGFPNYADTSHTLKNMSQAWLVVNYQGAPLPLGYSFGINVSSNDPNSYISLGLGTTSTGTGIAFETPGHTVSGGTALYMGPLSGYSSIGLALKIAPSGNVYARYLLDPAAGPLSATDPGWTALLDGGSEVIGHLDSSWLTSTDLKASFGTGSTEESVPEPSTMAVLGLVGAYFGFQRRKKINTQNKSI